MQDWSFVCSVVSGLADGVVLVDREFQLIDCNRMYVTMTGLRRRKLLTRVEQGALVFDLLSESPEIEKALAASCIETGKPHHVPWVAVNNEQGGTFEVMRTLAPVAGKSGEVAGILVMYRDVSAEAQMHDQYKEMIAKEAARAEELDRQVTLRTEQLRTALDEVTRLSRIDPLTGVLNRRAFTEHANQALALAGRHDRHCAILMCDLDFFKSVNDTSGHSAGDSLLVGVAGGLNELVRGSDKVARFGGEEFVILLAETEADAVHLVCERVREMVSELPVSSLVPGKEDPQTVSVGAAVFPEHGDSIEKLIEHADQALYSAKQTGRNRFVIYRDDLSVPGEAPAPVVHLSQGATKVLVVDEDESRLGVYRDALCQSFEVAVATTVGHALSACRRERFDVIVADEKVGGDRGITFLTKSLDLTPSAVRVLLVEAEDGFVSLLGANHGRVDHFLLRSDGPAHLDAVIQDGMTRRELALHELLANTDLGTPATDRVSAAALDTLIETHAFHMAYQPIVDVATREIEAYEALCRPHLDEFPHPGVLFDVALQQGMTWPLGDAVREMIADDLEKIDTKLFVNLHPAELANPQLLSGHPFSKKEAENIVYEITERSSIADLTTFQDHVATLRRFGYEFAIDDLGAGYASLNSVAQVEPEYIKVDMALIRDIDKSERKQSLVRSLASFANSANIRIIAEGVETEAEAETSREVGCHLLQGYLLGKPKPIDG